MLPEERIKPYNIFEREIMTLLRKIEAKRCKRRLFSLGNKVLVIPLEKRGSCTSWSALCSRWVGRDRGVLEGVHVWFGSFSCCSMKCKISSWNMRGLDDKEKRQSIHKRIFKPLNAIREIKELEKLVSTSGGLTA